MPRRSSRLSGNAAAHSSSTPGSIFDPSDDAELVTVAGFIEANDAHSQCNRSDDDAQHSAFCLYLQYWRWQTSGSRVETGAPMTVYHLVRDADVPSGKDPHEMEAPWTKAIQDKLARTDKEQVIILLKVYKEERDAFEGIERGEHWLPLPGYRFHSLVSPDFEGDRELSRVSQELLNSDTRKIIDEELGLELDHFPNTFATNCPIESRAEYEGSAEFCGEDCTVSIGGVPPIGHPLHRDRVFRAFDVLKTLVRDDREWKKKALDCATEHMLDLFNNNWADASEGTPPVNARQFRELQYVSSITILDAETGKFVVRLDTHNYELFTDHCIRVFGSLVEGFDKAML